MTQLRVIDRSHNPREAAEIKIKGVLAQREEILTAFVAKYGFQPDECEQIMLNNTWFVVRLDPDKVAEITRELVRERLRQRKVSWWKRFCLLMAGWH